MPEPGVFGERLRHEGGVDALGQRDLLDHHPERHQVVGRGQRVGVAQVDLLLTGRALVVGELHRDAHLLQHGDRPAAEVAAQALRRVVEVARTGPPASAARPASIGSLNRKNSTSGWV